MTSLTVGPDPVVLSADLQKDPTLDEKYAMTVPFSRDSARCECPQKTRWEEPLGCKGCAPAKELSKLKAEAIKQTQKRWDVWFSGARNLDNELSTRLGTLGYLHWEIRARIFRHVLNAYIPESFSYVADKDPFRERKYWDPPLGWPATKREFKERFQIEFSGHHRWPVPVELSKNCSLRSISDNYIARKFPTPIRLATTDMEFEFDHVFFSIMTLRFPCQKALHQFLRELSATQLSQVRSVTIELFACYACFTEKIDCGYENWGYVCGQLPSTLDSIVFEQRYEGCLWRRLEGMEFAVYEPDHVVGTRRAQRAKHKKEVLEFLICQVRDIAPKAEVNIVKCPDQDGRVWNAAMGETDEVRQKYLRWKMGRKNQIPQSPILSAVCSAQSEC